MIEIQNLSSVTKIKIPNQIPLLFYLNVFFFKQKLIQYLK